MLAVGTVIFAACGVLAKLTCFAFCLPCAVADEDDELID
jgi:hypothetical protein